MSTRTRKRKGRKDVNRQVKDPLFITKVPLMRDFEEPIAPPRKMIHFRHNALGVMTAVTATFSKRWYLNSVFQPEVATSGSCSGFSWWANFYGRYRVIWFKYRITIINREADATACGVYLGTIDPGTTAGITYSRQPLGQDTVLSAKGGVDRHTFTGSVLLSEIYGEANIDQDYSAPTTTNPTDLAYFAAILQTSGGGALTLGGAYELIIDYYVELFARNNLSLSP
jgi:hypothetical protein